MSEVPPTILIAIALFVVIVLRRFAPLPAAILGMLVTVGIGAWVFTRPEGTVGLAGLQVSQGTLWAFLGVLFGFEVLNLILAIQKRKRKQQQEQQEDV